MKEKIYLNVPKEDDGVMWNKGASIDKYSKKWYFYGELKDMPEALKKYIPQKPFNAAETEQQIKDQMKPREIKTTSSPQTINRPTPVPSFVSSTPTSPKSVQEVTPFNNNKPATNNLSQPKPAEPKKEEIKPPVEIDEEEIVFKKSRPKKSRSAKSKISKHFEIDAEIVQDLQFLATHYHLGMTAALEKIIKSQKALVEENRRQIDIEKVEATRYAEIFQKMANQMLNLENQYKETKAQFDVLLKENTIFKNEIAEKNAINKKEMEEAISVAYNKLNNKIISSGR